MCFVVFDTMGVAFSLHVVTQHGHRDTKLTVTDRVWNVIVNLTVMQVYARFAS